MTNKCCICDKRNKYKDNKCQSCYDFIKKWYYLELKCAKCNKDFKSVINEQICIDCSKVKPKRIKPIIRIPGSKFKMLNIIFEKFNNAIDKSKEFNYYEPFGGSLIVGINFVNEFLYDKNFKNAYINDYDNFFKNKEFDYEKIINSQITFSGIQRNISKLAIKQFLKLMKNGYLDRIKDFENILKNEKLKLNHWEFKDWINETTFNTNQQNIIYIDPPYFGSKYQKLYKNKINHEFLIKKIKELNKSPNNKIVISFNDREYIRNEFKSWNIYEFNKKSFISSDKRKEYNELLITNF